MGEEAIKLYGTLTFTAAVEANKDFSMQARPAAGKNDLSVVLTKSDQHYGSKKYKNVRRQAFLKRTQGKDESIMDFIAHLKYKIGDC